MKLKQIVSAIVVIILLLTVTPLCYSQESVRVTYYHANVKECGSSKGITASGLKVRDGMIATDWGVYPAGTILYCVETHEIWVAGDKGGAIHGNRIDRWARNGEVGTSGKLHVIVLYKPDMSLSARERVSRSFIIRDSIRTRMHQGFTELASRSGRTLSQQHIKTLALKLKVDRAKYAVPKNGKKSHKHSSHRRHTEHRMRQHRK